MDVLRHLLHMWITRFLHRWITVFFLSYVIIMLININIFHIFSVIHETKDENMTRKSKPTRELNMHMDNKGVITGTPSMIQPMNSDNIKSKIMRTEVICRRKMTAKTTPFIWNDDYHMWYNITKFKPVLNGKHSGG